MVNPFKTMWDYCANSGVRRDVPVFKRMWVEIPHIPIGMGISAACIGISFIYLQYFYDDRVGFSQRYLVMRSDDPRLKMFRDDVINADKYKQQ